MMNIWVCGLNREVFPELFAVGILEHDGDFGGDTTSVKADGIVWRVEGVTYGCACIGPLIGDIEFIVVPRNTVSARNPKGTCTVVGSESGR